MNYTVQAKSNPAYRRRNGICIFVVAAFVLFAVFMAVYTLAGDSDRRLLFGIGYIIAAVIGLMYIIIRINTVYATYIATDGEKIYMKNWKNDFLPYSITGKIKPLSAFVPAGTKITEIPVSDISSILIGTKNFIKRYAKTNDEFLVHVRGLEHSKDRYEKKQVQGMDIIYIETVDGECSYMPIVEFSPKKLNQLLKTARIKNPAIEIKSGNKKYKENQRNIQVKTDN